jgi:hypothetical protein
LLMERLLPLHCFGRDDRIECAGWEQHWLLMERLQIPRLPPDFLSSFVAPVNVMRLSSKKATYVVVDERSVVGNPEFARDDKVEAGLLT